MMSQEIREKQENHPQNDAASSSDQKEPEPPSWIIDINQRLSKRNENPINVVDDDDDDDDADAGEVCCIIDKYPAWRLNKIQEDAFQPYIASIGSLFTERSEMDEHKERLLVDLLAGRINTNMKQIKLEDLVKAMKLLEDKTRACYSEESRLTSDDYVKMMVVDGCFVIEVLRLHWQFTYESYRVTNYILDSILQSSSRIQKLQHDFLVFGNQLPFFVLKELYSLTSSDDGNTTEPPLRCLAIDFLRDFVGSTDVTLLKDDPRADECIHLLHLFSYACTSKYQRYLSMQEYKIRRLSEYTVVYKARKLTYNAKELQEAGVKIKPLKHTRDDGLMSISVAEGPITLRIQPFYLDNDVVFTLLNFLGSEQSHSHEANPYFTSFILFLDCLIDSEADVEVLHKAGILNHAYGSNMDVVNIIYKLARELKYPEYNHLNIETWNLNCFCKIYYESKSRTWWRNLMNNYFNSPWTIMSLVAATILLVLTFVQTFYTTYAYYKPPK